LLSILKTIACDAPCGQPLQGSLIRAPMAGGGYGTLVAQVGVSLRVLGMLLRRRASGSERSQAVALNKPAVEVILPASEELPPRAVTMPVQQRPAVTGGQQRQALLLWVIAFERQVA
jgi:hypothetical protein